MNFSSDRVVLRNGAAPFLGVTNTYGVNMAKGSNPMRFRARFASQGAGRAKITLARKDSDQIY